MVSALLLLNLLVLANATEPNWSQGAPTPIGGRPNPYQISDTEIPATIRAGRLHALNYPITVSGLILPERPIKNFIDGSGLGSFDDLQNWLGLNEYPQQEGEGPYYIPFEFGQRPSHRMGYSKIGQGFSISCAQCHSSNLFGRVVLGLTNRFPRANEFFVQGLKVAPLVDGPTFQWLTGATKSETLLYRRARYATQFVGAKQPVQLGLDTSLAQVAMSLAKRAPDEWATRKESQRDEPLSTVVADSKPAVWWNLKYKNRWLSDGSVVSGNPIFTNFLWNEIGRGTDLKELDRWLNANPQTVKELTTAVFSSEAPKWTDFFPAEGIPEDQARLGQKIFQQRCAGCHGVYQKAWDLPQMQSRPWAERLQTVQVIYHQQTPVIDVGTDAARRRGMKSLEQLNRLQISKTNGILVKAQAGYVPPPLVGIWARWPYFHNNSAPSLCAVLMPARSRPVTYWAREAADPRYDFDSECNGYPLAAPRDGIQKAKFDARLEGSSNRGHDEGIFLRNGREILSSTEKLALIRFLQTL